MEKTRSSHRLGFTIGIVAVVLVLVRLVIGTPEEDSTLNRAAAAQLAAAADAQPILTAPETTEVTPTPPPAPPPPVDEEAVALEAAPEEDLIDDASGSDPSEPGEDMPVERQIGSGASRGQSGPRVMVDNDHN